MALGHCPECETELKLGNSSRKGQKLTCPSCGASLEVVVLSPIELDWTFDEEEEDAPEYEYDFEDEDDFEDDDFDEFDD